MDVVAPLQPVVGGRLVGYHAAGRVGHDVVVGQAVHVHIGQGGAVVNLVAEGAVDLEGDVEAAVAEADVGAQQHLGHGLAGDVAVLAVLEVDAAAVEVGNVVLVAAVAVGHEAVAAGQVKDAQGLAHNLIDNVVVAAVEAGSVQARDGRVLGGRNPLAVILSAQREQLVALPGEVGVDGQLHVPGAEGRDAHGHLQAAVAHGADVGQQRVVGEGRDADVVGVEHVRGLGAVGVEREQQAAVEHGQVEAGVEGVLHLPLQVGVGVAQGLVGDQRRVAHGHNAVGLHQRHGGVGVDAALVARQAVAEAHLQVVYPRDGAHEVLLRHIPRHGGRGEEAPLVVGAELGRGVGAGVEGEHVAVVERIVDAGQEGHQARVVVVGARPLPGAQGAALQVVVAHGVGGEVGDGGVEAREGLLGHLAQGQQVDEVAAGLLLPGQHHVAQQGLRAATAAIGLSASPDGGGQVLVVLRLAIRVGAEEHQLPVERQGDVEPRVGAEVGRGVAVVHLHPRQGVGNLAGRRQLVPSARGVAPRREGGIEGGGGVEGLLEVEQGAVALDGAEEAQLAIQQAVYQLLVEVHVGGEQLHRLVADDTLTLQVAQRDAVVRPLASAIEGYVVVLLDACLLDGLLEVGVVSQVHGLQPAVGNGPSVGVGAEHVQAAVGVGDAEVAAVVDVRLAARAPLGDDVDDARSAARAVLGRLRGVLEDGEALDVGGIERGQHGEVAGHAVHHYQGLVAAGQRGGAPQADRLEGGGAVAVLLDGEPRHTPLDGLQRIGEQLSIHLFLGDKLYGARQVVQRAAGIAHMEERIGRL